MNDADRRLLAEIAERAAAYQRWLKDDGPNPDDLWQAVDDRRELLRIVREQEARITALEAEAEYAVGALNDPDVLGTIAKNRLKAVLGWDHGAEDQADDAAAERATAGKWGGS